MCATWLFFLLCADPSGTPCTPETLVAFCNDPENIKAREAELKREIEATKIKFGKAKRAPLGKSDSKADRAELLKTYATNLELLGQLLNDPVPLPIVIVNRPQPGQIGVLAKERWPDGRLEYVEWAKVFQVTGKTSAIVEIEKEHFWLDGIATETVTDGSVLQLGGKFFQVKGSKPYTTVTGASRTVFAFASYDPNALFVAARLARVRLWTDVSGKYKVRAAVANVDGLKVVLRKEDGSTVEVKRELLASECQKLLDELAE